jgi:hypothetical protein
MNMSVKVLIPKHLGRYVNDKSEIDIEASDLKATLDILSRDYELEDIFLTREGNLQAFIRVVVDEALVTARRAEDLRQVAVSGKTVEIQTAFAGG